MSKFASRLHKTGTKSFRGDFVSIIIVFYSRYLLETAAKIAQTGLKSSRLVDRVEYVQTGITVPVSCKQGFGGKEVQPTIKLNLKKISTFRAKALEGLLIETLNFSLFFRLCKNLYLRVLLIALPTLATLVHA